MTLHRTLLQGLIVSLRGQINIEQIFIRSPSPTASVNAADASPAGMSVPFVASEDEIDFEEDREDCSVILEDTSGRIMNDREIYCMDPSDEGYDTPDSLDSLHLSLLEPRPRGESEDMRVEQLMASILTEY